jgi:sialidase-1
MQSRHLALVAAVLSGIAGSLSNAASLEDVHVVKMPKGTHGYRGMNGDFLPLKDGSLLYCYTQSGIVAVKSRDRGKTWGEPFTLVPDPQAPARGYYCHPSLLRVQNNEILLAYNYSTHPATPYYAKVFYRRSADEGRTWTDQFLVTPYAGYTLVHNDKLLSLKDGRIIAVAEQKEYLPSTQDHSGYVGMCFYSDDNGHSWHPSKNKVDLYQSQKVEVQEPDAVELKDGRLLMFARTYSGHPVRAYSSDRGETWTAGEMIRELPMPYAGLPTVRRIPSTGDLLFLWITERSVDKQNPQVHWRCALSCAVSRDEGRTFGPLRHIARNPEDDFGYQCVEFLSDDLVLVGYHARDGLHVARFGVDWLYGKP